MQKRRKIRNNYGGQRTGIFKVFLKIFLSLFFRELGFFWLVLWGFFWVFLRYLFCSLRSALEIDYIGCIKLSPVVAVLLLNGAASSSSSDSLSKGLFVACTVNCAGLHLIWKQSA